MVKMNVKCIPCIIAVRVRELNMLPLDDRKMFYILNHIIKYLAHYTTPEINMTRLATQAFRILKKLSGFSDPYVKEKSLANKTALIIAEEMNNYINSLKGYEKTIFLLKLATLGNALDFGIAGYHYNIKQVVSEISTMNIALNNIPKLMELIIKSKKIAYLLDNAGEAIFDKLLIEELASLGKDVVVVVKSGSFQNDITFKEARELGFHEKARLLGTKSDASSIFIDEISRETLDEILSADLVIAKGMAHYEYLSSEKFLKKPVAYLLKAKCEVIANDLNVPIGSYVIKIEVP